MNLANVMNDWGIVIFLFLLTMWLVKMATALMYMDKHYHNKK